MNDVNPRPGRFPRTLATLIALACAGMSMIGCSETDGFLFDASKTGYFEHQPTMIPILERIDVIEGHDLFSEGAAGPEAEDLLPSDLTYRLTPGDILTVEIAELLDEGRIYARSSRVDAAGFIRIPYVGTVRAAGRTEQELEDELIRVLEERVITNPQVTVTLEDGGGFSYTVYGFVAGSGIYAIRRADFRLMEALALAGGVPPSARELFVIRQIPLIDEVAPMSRPRDEGTGGSRPGPRPAGQPDANIDDLIDLLDDGAPTGGGGGGAFLGPDAQPVRPATPPKATAPTVLAGVLRQDTEPVIDIDSLEPVRISDQPMVDLDELRRRRAASPVQRSSVSYVFVEERGEWVPVDEAPAMPGNAGGSGGGGGNSARANGADGSDDTNAADRLVAERIIRIPLDGLLNGEARYNVVVRPHDRIYIVGPESGVVYVDGEVIRPGVYGMPQDGGMLTLSRLVTAAGGLNGIAEPKRVDLTRIVGVQREATIRVNLAAIRNRTEPDIVLKPDDHIIVGTSAAATFMAVVRGGFRFTYGFGFLLDRNFGNDVFGAPPSNNN